VDKYPSIFSAQNRGYCVYYPSKGFHMHLILKPENTGFLAVKTNRAKLKSKI